MLDHTADAGVLAWGPTPEAAFEHAARGMFEIVIGTEPESLEGVEATVRLDVDVEGSNWQALVVNWLAEMVYYFDVEGFVPLHYSFDACAPPRCAATLEGIYLGDPEQAGGVGIKAVTYHQLLVEVGPERTELQVIFDI